jgi:nitrous oxidase accessory protein NosD
MLLFFACQKDTTPAVDESNYYTPKLSDFAVDRSGYWTTIPAGSTNALAQAIAEADPGGIIYLKAGTHTETDRVRVDKRVHIIGETGAVLMIASLDTVATHSPAIHILNAPGAVIQNVDIRPFNNGAYTAVLLENSPGSAVLSSKLTGFPVGVLVEKSDRIALMYNTLEGTGTDNGILVNNGKSAYIADNDISGFGIGLWACDRWGTSERNNFHDNYNGTLLCKYNAVFGATIPGSSTPLGAESTCVLWKLRNNKFINNIENGLSIRDSSNRNFIESSNEYSGNVLYDIWIPADEDLIPGVLFVPAAYDNTIHAAPGVLIKNCGINNTVVGGTISPDPC